MPKGHPIKQTHTSDCLFRRGRLIPWCQSVLAVISGRGFAWILMVYWSTDYPRAMNQLNKQVASHPVNIATLAGHRLSKCHLEI